VKFANKIAYVTGASSGIGRGAALRLAHEGAQVVLIGRQKSHLDSAVADGGAKCSAVQMDVSDAMSVNEILKRGRILHLSTFCVPGRTQ
jgi:NAD(P)-dependent dehydrogenase (short-subunit alcohol dehydrogenase family)